MRSNTATHMLKKNGSMAHMELEMSNNMDAGEHSHSHADEFENPQIISSNMDVERTVTHILKRNWTMTPLK